MIQVDPLHPPSIEQGGHVAGRPAILDYFKSVLVAFDRRFESRELTLLDGPHEEGNSVRIRGSAT